MDAVPTESGTIRSRAGIIFFVFTIFFINMLSRLGMAPLLPGIEAELGLRHVEPGSLFLFVSVGHGCGLFTSPFISARMAHPHLIVLSAMAVGASLFGVALSTGLSGLRASFLMLGFSGGLYLPSGIALLTFLVRKQDWGKALSIHQLAPNLAYICAPWAAAAFVGQLSWRHAVAGYGAASVVAGIVFLVFAGSAGYRGQAPNLKRILDLAKTPAIWVMILLFGLALGVNQGVFSILPLYLTAERKLDLVTANHLLAVSRVVAFAIPLVTGWISDKYGLKRTLYATVGASAVATLAIAQAPAEWLGAGLILQAVASVCFFPLGFAVLSTITTRDNRSMAVALTMPIGHFIGAGLVPTLIGYAGDVASFSRGIEILGGLTFVGMVLMGFIRLPKG